MSFEFQQHSRHVCQVWSLYAVLTFSSGVGLTSSSGAISEKGLHLPVAPSGSRVYIFQWRHLRAGFSSSSGAISDKGLHLPVAPSWSKVYIFQWRHLQSWNRVYSFQWRNLGAGLTSSSGAIVEQW
ncbi:hypothetical protein Bpfe_005423 [Biomphalaria pfeifferi]|uniref:Uncharacterized protein n=1 Tax=Biomphalaria pfeifferi TaxID=112525 RepID=A0AAD8C2P8_BIOPF|nr:hypothetical protein Bpfe_005423 [Biomphalaria pfeifferi]